MPALCCGHAQVHPRFCSLSRLPCRDLFCECGLQLHSVPSLQVQRSNRASLRILPARHRVASWQYFRRFVSMQGRVCAGQRPREMLCLPAGHLLCSTWAKFSMRILWAWQIHKLYRQHCMRPLCGGFLQHRSCKFGVFELSGELPLLHSASQGNLSTFAFDCGSGVWRLFADDG